MIKLKVAVEFFDKYTKELYKVGTVIEVEDVRGKELLSDSRNLVIEVKKAKGKK